MSTELLERTEISEETELGDPEYAHIVKTGPGERAVAKVTEAMIYGTPLEALCGYVWVPSKDPKKLPVCPVCEEIYELWKMSNGDLNDVPGT